MCDLKNQNLENAEYFGYTAQSNQLIEECAELIQAVSKYRRAEVKTEDEKMIALANLVEELADVEIMIEQIKYLLQVPDEDILALKQYKVNRTKERIAGRG